MPDAPQTSNQMQSLTTSQEGTARVAKLNPESHFFIEGGENSGDFNQTEAFGPINDTQFRTTSVITLSGDADIYALCMGTTFLQPQQGSTTKVNLILKPYKQPVKGLNIKYVVYRGLNRSDFFDGDKIAGTEDSGSGFVQEIWKQFNKFYGPEDPETPPQFFAKFIGFPITADELSAQPDARLIDDCIYDITKFLEDEALEEDPDANNYELPIIPRGTQLGTLVSGSQLGIDIVLNDGDYIIESDIPPPFEFNLEYARVASYNLDTSTEPNDFRKKLIRENATKFIDITAFYGLHANGAGKLYVDDNETPLIGKSNIANRLQNFTTKNNFYLYIQANRQRSYNFYNNYIHSNDNSNTIKIGTVADSLDETTFGTNSWPIHVIDQSQDPSNNNNSIIFQLTTDNYDGAALFIKTGVLASPHEENFVRNTNLFQQPSEDESVVIDVNYTQSIILNVPAVSGNTVASLAQLIYEGKQLFATDAANPDLQYVLKDIDDVFGLINAKSIFAFNQDSELPTVVNDKLQIINFPNAIGGNDISSIKYQKVEDEIKINNDNFLSRVTYETLKKSFAHKIHPYAKNTTSVIEGGNYNFLYKDNTSKSNLYKPKSPYFIRKKIFNDSNIKITGIILLTYDNTKANKKILGITKIEFEELNSIMQENNIINAKLFFKNVLFDERAFIESDEGVSFKKYTMCISGENANNQFVLIEPETSILVYTLDELIYSSLDYSKAIPDESTVEDLINIDLVTD